MRRSPTSSLRGSTRLVVSRRSRIRYLQDARYGYLRWGAEAKVRQLDQLYPQLRKEEPATRPTSTIGAPVEQLDLATVIKVSQAVSGEIVLEKLVDTLMRTAIEHAGAERGLLIFPSQGGGQRIEAEATTTGDDVVVHLQDASVTSSVLPESIIRYVIRTHESVVLDDASAPGPFSADTYVVQRHARSILCLPLINQGKLIGLLYLENNLTPHVFTPTRIAVLKLVASQAAISLENTRLYADLAERESKIRRLVDANVIGIFIWDLEGRILEANEAFLNMVQYSRDDLLSGHVRWTDLTPPEWRESDQKSVEELKATGRVQPYEKEYFRKDGTLLPVMIGAAIFEGRSNEGVAFVLDLTELKRLEQERERLRQELAHFAHLNRVSTMGELTASLAHEINQPLAAIVTNAQVCLRWLMRDVPNLEEVREAAELIARDGKRASDVISRIRALVRKTGSGKAQLDINQAIEEVVHLTEDEALRKGVVLRTELAGDLPFLLGDRVQLQQVLLNLIINGVEAMSSVADGRRDLLVYSRLHESNQVLVGVQDSGVGIEPENLKKIFDPFYTTKSQGMGMGLAISRSIVENHGGKLWASRNDGRGATFQFTLLTYQ